MFALLAILTGTGNLMKECGARQLALGTSSQATRAFLTPGNGGCKVMFRCLRTMMAMEKSILQCGAPRTALTTSFQAARVAPTPSNGAFPGMFQYPRITMA